jgi:murein L,D-transpeptidase YafK
VFKHSRELELWVQSESGAYQHFKTFPICYFSGQVGPKKKQGDLQVPEGFYEVSAQSLNPFSSYHLSFNIGYPNRLDRQLKRTGGLIMVHGGCVSAGCLAMTNSAIERIYAIIEETLRSGHRTVPVHVFPFRMGFVNRVRFVRFPYWDFLEATSADVSIF